MPAFIISFFVGVICIILGVSNRKGNISSLHSYHRHRVSKEDRIPFGKKVGLGTIVIGCAIIVYSVLSVVTLLVQNDILALLGTVMLVIGLVVGLIISFYAMKKYNKGIF